MKLFSSSSALASLASLAIALAVPLAASAQNISIATGGTGGVYYPMGGGLAAVLSKHVPGMQATAGISDFLAERGLDAHVDIFEFDFPAGPGAVPLNILRGIFGR